MALLRRVIGAVLRRVRQHQGRTLREVAEAAGVSLPYLSEVERGTKEASSEVLAAICRALGLPMPDLLDEVRKELLRDAPAPRAAMNGSAPRVAMNGSAPRVAMSGSAPRVATAATPHLRLRCVTQRSGDGGTGAGSAVTCGLGGRPRSAARLRLSCRPALSVYAGHTAT